MALARRIPLLSALIGLVLGSLALASLVFAATAHADGPFDPTGFRLSSSAYYVHENAGQAVIEIDRTDTSLEAQIRYLALPGTAMPGVDFDKVKGMIDFQPGQSSATFTVPIIDHGMPGIPKTVRIGLFGPSPIGLAVPNFAILTIINDDPLSIARDPLNPLGLATTPPAGDPLTGAQAFVDQKYGLSAMWARRWRFSHPVLSRMLGVIAREPTDQRWGNWTPTSQVGVQASQFLEYAATTEPGTVPELSTYYLNDGHCTGTYSDPPSRVAQYHNWIENLSAGIGDYRAIMFLEMDSVITMGCLGPHGRAVRLGELHDAINILSKQNPRLVVYVDAGAGDASPAWLVARYLREAGVNEIQGFFLNSTHFDWTSNEIRYGEQISRLTGGKHFVVSTTANGRGPLVPPDPGKQGNEILCNPPGRGLGPLPTFDTGYRNVDAFAWIGIPGKSGGTCRPGAPPVGYYWPAYALMLVRNAYFKVH